MFLLKFKDVQAVNPVEGVTSRRAVLEYFFCCCLQVDGPITRRA